LATIKVDQAHSLSIDDAKRAVERFGERIAKYGMKLHWKGTEADLKGTGASGKVSVTPSNVNVTVKLGMLAKAAGVDPVRLEQSITKRLAEALAGTES